MSEIKPNHICKNPNCRKLYYACNFCDKSNNWRSVACSLDCFKEYTDLVIEERTKGKKNVMKPERTDMTEKEVDELLNKPLEVVLQETKEQLKEYANEDGTIDFKNAVDEINKNIDKKSCGAKRKTVKSVTK